MTESTLDRIEEVNTQTGITPRYYLGMSQIGHSCPRYLQYYFRSCFETDISARVGRIFQVGHKAEADMIADLKSAGVEVYGEQDSYKIAYGHCKGHNDGLGKGFAESPKDEHVIEFKTSNDANFKKLIKEGVEQNKPVHYAQMTMYGHLKGLDWAFYMVLNKNTSAYYTERIKIDHDFAKQLIEKAERIVITEELMPKIGNMTWYECKFCDAYSICQLNNELVKHCRNCKFASVEDDGVWWCTKKDEDITDIFPLCSDYELDEWLM